MKRPMKSRLKDFLIIMPFALVFAGVGLMLHPMTDTEEALSSAEAKYLLEQGIPEEVLRNSQAHGKYETDMKIFPISINSPVKIDFEKLKTMSRKGRGEDINLAILEQNTSDLMSEEDFTFSTSGMGWGLNFFIGDKGNQDLNPHVMLTLKTISSELLHTTFRARLSMLFRYPVSLGVGLYDEKQKQLGREVELFIISDEENERLKDLFPKGQAPLGVHIAFFAIGGAFFLWGVRQIF